MENNNHVSGRDEFILLLFTAARKCRVELERDVLTFIASANASVHAPLIVEDISFMVIHSLSELVDMFADYVATPFALAAHCDRLELFWFATFFCNPMKCWRQFSTF